VQFKKRLPSKKFDVVPTSGRRYVNGRWTSFWDVVSGLSFCRLPKTVTSNRRRHATSSATSLCRPVDVNVAILRPYDVWSRRRHMDVAIRRVDIGWRLLYDNITTSLADVY